MRIIIAIDIFEGRCVRLTKGDFSTARIYNEDPIDMARQIEDNGLGYVHLVDLDGALNRKITNYKILEKIARTTSLNIDFGGGIRSDDDIKTAFECGASQITCGSIAATNRDQVLKWLERYGTHKIILGADSHGRIIATEGWTNSSGSDVIDFISGYRKNGISYTICTDIEKDGMLLGPSTELYREILGIEGIKLIASGGISTSEQIKELESIGCEGAIIGKALYEGLLDLKELSLLC
jgi:phosphoribosylformimino-5-aminoimidazole carboxamide ribotide isomerase